MSQSLLWLPMKATIGLIAVGVFIAGGMTTSIVLTHAQDRSNQASRAEHAAQSVDMTIAMTDAMMSDDRDAFIAFGENTRTQDQLARFWDDTKKIGWEVGGAVAGSLDKVEGLDYTNSLAFLMQLGTDARQADPDSDGVFALTTNIDYKVEFSDTNQKLTSMEPVIPMPWDTEAGTFVEKRDHIALYGFANDSELISSRVDGAEEAARIVVETSRFPTEAEFGRVSRTAVFITSNQDQYSAALDRDWGGEQGGGPTGTPDFQNSSQGMTLGFPESSFGPTSTTFTDAAISGGGHLILVNASDPGVEVNRVVAHELTHVIFNTNQEPELIQYEASTNVVKEGYARYLESIAMGRVDDLRGQHLRDVIEATPNLDVLMSDAAFRSSETAADAYLASASFLYFVDQYSDHDLYWLISSESGYEYMPFTLWTTYDEGITYQDWLAWLQAE